MDTDEDKIRAGLIKAELWVTPLQARVIQAVLDAMTTHHLEGHMLKELQVLSRMFPDENTPPMPKSRR